MGKLAIKKSLRKTVLQIFVVVLSLVMVSMFFLTTYIFSEVLKYNNKELAKSVSHEVSSSVDNYLKGYEMIVESLAKQDIFSDYKADDNRTLIRDTLKSFASQESDLFYIYYGTEDGEMFVFPDNSYKSSSPKSQQWYVNGKLAEGFTWSNPYYDNATGEYVVTACQPVYKQGVLQGVIGIDISLQMLMDKVNDIRIGEKGYAFIVDKNQVVLAHRNPEIVGTITDVPEILDALIGNGPDDFDYAYIENGVEKSKFASLDHLTNADWAVISTMYYDEVEEGVNAIAKFFVAAALAAILLAVVLVFLATRKFNRNIRSLVETMTQAKGGDMRARAEFKSHDEIGLLAQYFNEMIEDIGALVGNIHSGSETLLDVSENLAAMSEEVTASAEDISKTVEEITLGSQNQANDSEQSVMLAMSLADKFKHLESFTADMQSTVESSDQVYNTGLESISNLQMKNETANVANQGIERVILELDSKTGEITTILQAISAISVQTNLLALNASIEAARAGEHGRGFAVVADEIRKLAEESAQSANEIGLIMTRIGDGVKETVESMTSLKSISEEQTQAVEVSIEAFEALKASYVKISAYIGHIVTATQALELDKDKIIANIENISAVTEETAASTEEVNASMEQQVGAIDQVAQFAQKLNGLSRDMREDVSKFKI